MEKGADAQTLSLDCEDYSPLFSEETLHIVETLNIWHIYSL